jgi:hypothetical protein
VVEDDPRALQLLMTALLAAAALSMVFYVLGYVIRRLP